METPAKCRGRYVDTQLYNPYVGFMKAVNALELRQSLGRVLRQLERGGAPILVQRGRQPAAVLISLQDYQERFADREADERRRTVVEQIKAAGFSRPRGRTTLDLLRELRAAGRS